MGEPDFPAGISPNSSDIHTPFLSFSRQRRHFDLFLRRGGDAVLLLQGLEWELPSHEGAEKHHDRRWTSPSSHHHQPAPSTSCGSRVARYFGLRRCRSRTTSCLVRRRHLAMQMGVWSTVVDGYALPCRRRGLLHYVRGAALEILDLRIAARLARGFNTSAINHEERMVRGQQTYHSSPHLFICRGRKFLTCIVDSA